MSHFYENIPAELRCRRKWVAWGIRDAPPKSPFRPESLLSGRRAPAKSGVAHTWGSYRAAVECVTRGLVKGIGYELDGTDGIAGVDLDHVISEGVLSPQAREIVDKLASYTEISPSGTGLHIFVKADSGIISRHRRQGCFIEIYSDLRYFTVTGNVYGEPLPIAERTAELRQIHGEYLKSDTERGSAVLIVDEPDMADTQFFLQTGLKRDRVFSDLWNGVRRCGNESADDIALMNKLAYWCNANPPAMLRAFMSSPHYASKDDAHKRKCQRQDYLPNTAQNACETVYSTARADYEIWHKERRKERIVVR